MGEYIAINGQSVKLGTCENLYYTRYNDLRAALPYARKTEGNLSPASYLDDKSGFRFRFPFPEEDGVKIGHYEPFEKSLTVTIPAQIAPNLANGLYEWDHYECYHSFNATSGYTFSVKFPCPFSKDATKHPDFKIVGICQQRPFNGELWTIIECPFCGRRVRIDKPEALELANCVLNYFRYHDPDYGSKVAERILQGYK